MNTNFITTTQLREQSTRVVQTLVSGQDLTLIHRSKMIGVIKPVPKPEKIITDLVKFQKTLEALKPKKIISRYKRDVLYRKYLKEKYG